MYESSLIISVGLSVQRLLTTLAGFAVYSKYVNFGKLRDWFWLRHL